MVHDRIARVRPGKEALESPDAYLKFIVDTLYGYGASAPLAIKTFKPLKPWISESTWQVLRLVAPVRRQRVKAQTEVILHVLSLIMSS